MAIKFKGSETSGSVPTGIGERELSWNIADKKIFTADSSGSLVEFSGKDENAVWGNITGTIANQTDLKTALDNKQDDLGLGTAGQVLATNSGADDIEWIDLPQDKDELVKISSTDTTAGYLEDKVTNGNGIYFNTSSGNEQLEINADVFLTTIGGNLIPVYIDSNRGKTLSVEATTPMFSEARLNSTEWMSLGKATDALTGFIAPFDGTIVGVFGHTSGSGNQTIQIYIDGTNIGTALSFSGTGEQGQIDNSLDYNFTAGQKIRLRGGGGDTMEDTNIELRLKWRA